ncbi:MAG TPA: hypothetical protein VLX91_04635 [Candidatus Acidoferrales bacterium]|nr:hypothetical protein [Candidatus Acidoferrales bacterium]
MDGVELRNHCSIAIALIMVLSPVIFLEGCTTNPTSLTGTWNLVSITETNGSQTTTLNSASAVGSLALSANFTFSVDGVVTSQSGAELLGFPVGSTGVATGNYSYSGAYRTISFYVTSWSGKGSQTGSISGTYTLSGNALFINLNIRNAAVTVNLSRAQ